ncbi:hypothetical protein UFOVP1130_37 [uncultured Caudovirales phage]|uniref:Uncharacterized protein n=1 Tax=uncultured Caudovirales phage TaxID=2100421 RepID=A0A6J5QVF8_9CAUD|nr:hypothetical protein UFOVP1130_37 [uncultured Caudovirales phage]
MAGFWKDVLKAAVETTETGQAIAQLKQAKTDYDAAKTPPPPPPPTVLTPIQKTAVAGAALNRLRGTGTAPAPTPPPTPTPIARPTIKVSTPTGVRPTIKVTPPRILTPLQQQAAVAVSKQNPNRPNLVTQPSTRPSWDPDNDPDWMPAGDPDVNAFGPPLAGPGSLLKDVSAPTIAPVAKTRTQTRPSKRGLGPQAEAAFASLRQHLNNQ